MAVPHAAPWRACYHMHTWDMADAWGVSPPPWCLLKHITSSCAPAVNGTHATRPLSVRLGQRRHRRHPAILTSNIHHCAYLCLHAPPSPLSSGPSMAGTRASRCATLGDSRLTQAVRSSAWLHTRLSHPPETMVTCLPCGGPIHPTALMRSSWPATEPQTSRLRALNTVALPLS